MKNSLEKFAMPHFLCRAGNFCCWVGAFNIATLCIMSSLPPSLEKLAPVVFWLFVILAGGLLAWKNSSDAMIYELGRNALAERNAKEMMDVGRSLGDEEG